MRVADQRRRLLEGVGGREHDDAVGPGRGEQAAVEIVVGDERAAADEGDHTGMAADCTSRLRGASVPTVAAWVVTAGN